MKETIVTRGAPVVRVLAVLLVALFAVSGIAAAHGGDDGLHHHDGTMGSHDGWMGGAGWVWGPLFVLVLLALPLVAVLLLLRERGDSGGGEDDALAVLRRRYATGEIDDEEFEQRRQRLQEG